LPRRDRPGDRRGAAGAGGGHRGVRAGADRGAGAMSTTTRVGFVGLGSQGGPMARRIVDAGFPTTVWARRPDATAAFAGTGAAVARDLVALGAASDVLGVCVVADADVEQVLDGPDGALAGMAAGGIVVIHSTVHPDTCRRLQRRHPALAILDAPVS